MNNLTGVTEDQQVFDYADHENWPNGIYKVIDNGAWMHNHPRYGSTLLWMLNGKIRWAFTTDPTKWYGNNTFNIGNKFKQSFIKIYESE